MAVEFRCADAGARCPAAFVAATEDELVAQIERHLIEEHAIGTVTQTLQSYVRSLVVSVPEARGGHGRMGAPRAGSGLASGSG